MFNAKNRIHKIVAKRLNGGKIVSRCTLRNFLEANKNRTFWYKSEPFHIQEISNRWVAPDDPYQNRYMVFDSPLSAINPHVIYYRYGSWGDLFVVYRHVLLKIDTSGRLNLYYSHSCDWTVTDTNITAKDLKSILYVTMFGDVMEEYVSGKYDEDIYELLNLFIKNDSFFEK